MWACGVGLQTAVWHMTHNQFHVIWGRGIAYVHSGMYINGSIIIQGCSPAWLPYVFGLGVGMRS